MMNLWNPTGHLSLVSIVMTSLFLGMLHGITPDEHTWPITFSYSVGSFSARGGLKAGLFFSLAFTTQRAVAAEIAFFSLHAVMLLASWQYAIYLVVGLLMAVSGAYVLRLGRPVHFLGRLQSWLEARLHMGGDGAKRIDDGGEPFVAPRQVPVRLALLHGFVAGWGTGAFALIIYTVMAPQMPSAATGFIPGLVFGLGTLVMQMLLGALFGWWITRLRVDRAVLPIIARRMSGSVLLYGGLAFAVVGTLGLFFPLDQLQISTGIHIHNLDSLNVGTFLAVIVVAAVAWTSLFRSLREIRARAVR